MKSPKKKLVNGLGASRKLQIQPLESRVVLAASVGWDGPGLGSAELTYYIANSPSSLSQAQTNQAIETALRAWSSVADISFVRTNQPGLRNSIDFSFTKIDGPAKTLAQSYFPDDVNSGRIAGDVQFDSAEQWEVGNGLGSQAFDLVLTAVHEIGHSLGLEHSKTANSVMVNSISTQNVFNGLSDADKVAILELYHGANGTGSEDTSSNSGATIDDSNDADSSAGGASGDSGDNDNNPFPRDRWRFGGSWQRFGSRTSVGSSYIHNLYLPHDVNGDLAISPSDALAVINVLNGDANIVNLDLDSIGLCDTNNDGNVTPTDALQVINAINSGSVELVDTVVEVPTVDSTNDSNFETKSVGSSSGATDRTRVLAMFSADRLIERFDADSSSSLTESELPERLWQILVDAQVDANSDASVTLAELKAAITTARRDLFDSKDSDSNGMLVPTEVGDRLWSKLQSSDTDSNGSVSFDELDAWLAKRATSDHLGGGHEHHGYGHHHGPTELWQIAADALFERFDANNDSVLTETELPGKILANLISADVDSSKDGSIAKGELTTAITAARAAYFTKTDSNDDGQLSKEEVGMRTWHKLSAADSDSNGTISLEELQAWVPTKHGHTANSSTTGRQALRGGRRR